MSPSWPRPRLPRRRRRDESQKPEEPQASEEPPAPEEPPATEEPPAPDEPEAPDEYPEFPLVEMPSQEPKRRRRPRLPARPRRPHLRRRPAGQPGPVRRFVGRVMAGAAAVVGVTAGVLRPIGRALGVAGSYLAAVGRELGLAIADAWAGVATAWGGIDLYLRRRIVLAAALAAAAVVFLLVAVPALPCQYPGGDVCPPPDDAAGLVPDDSLAYVHFDTDTSSEPYQDASALLRQVPALSGQLTGRLLDQLPASGGSATRFATAVRPWLGDELAVALIPARGRPQEIQLLSVGDRKEAQAFQDRLEGSRSETIPYRGVDLVRGRGGVASAFVEGFLVIGTTAGTETAIDVATGAPGAKPLAGSAAARVRTELPAMRVADAYLSPAGAAAVAGRPGGLLAPLAPFFAPRATDGVALGLTVDSNALELAIRSDLDPKRAADRPGFFAAFPSFEPTLAERLPADTLAYVGLGHPGRAIAALLRQASTEEPGLARALTRLIAEGRRAAGVPVRGDLLEALGKEGALALEPARGPIPGAPYVLYIGSGIDPERARAALARLETPLAHAVGSAPGGGPARFRTSEIAGVEAQTLQVSPTVELSYAIVGHDLVVATNPIGIAAVARGGLASSDAYREATSGLPEPASLVAYLDLSGLVALAEQAGLATDPAYRPFASDFHNLDQLGVSALSSTRKLDTDARLVLRAGSLQSRTPTTGENEPNPDTFR